MANTFTFANQSLTDADIYGGISYICDLNTGDEFSIGNAASACVKFVTDKQVPLYTKDQTNGYFEWVQDLVSRGTYYVTECVKVNGSWYSVTAYDAMILLDTSITALSLSYPLTVSAAASAIAAYIGCTVSGTIYNGTMACDALDDTTTIRELLGWAAEASGASVKIDAADHIVFLYYAASGITVTASDYKEDGLDVADYTCAAIDNVTILDMAGMTHATAGSGTNSLFIQGNPFLYDATNTEAAVILGLVDSFVYAPFTCEMFDENGLDVGMTATFGTVTTLVMHIESDEEGAVASAVGSDSRAELNKDLDVMVNEALAVASDAQQTAQELNLHFWYTASGSEAGAHIAEVDKPTFESNPTGGNLLSSSNGIAVRDGLTELASFGSTATIGLTSDYHLDIASAGAVIKKGATNLLKITGRIVDAASNWKRAFISIVTGSNDAQIYMDASDTTGGTNISATAGDAIAQMGVGASTSLGKLATVNLSVSKDGGMTGPEIRVSTARDIVLDGKIYLTNGKAIYTEDSNGNDRALVTSNSQDQYTFGNGSYYYNEGSVYYDGNVVNIRSKGNINVTGNIISNGSIRVSGHSSAIGTIVNGTRSSSAGSVGTSYKTVASVSLTAGTWVINAYNSFNGGTAGSRRVLITTDSSGTTDAGAGSSTGYAPANTQVVVRSMHIVTLSETTTYYMRCKSASTVDSPYGNISAVRIA